jgi:hypothetical protein
VKEPVTTPPLEIVQVEPVTIVGSGVLVIGTHVPASAGAKPLPVTVTTVLTGPELGKRAIVGVGLVTVNTAWARSPVLPVTVIVYAWGATLATVKLAELIDLVAPESVSVQDGLATGVPVIVQVPVSLAAKSLPVMVTVAPIKPEDGCRIIVGPLTVNDA